MHDLRYPIGRCSSKSALSFEERATAIEAIEQAPDRLKAAIAGRWQHKPVANQVSGTRLLRQ